jgi:hypothetical protein
MSKFDEYRKNAADAQEWANKARSDTDRAAWLRVAEGWLGLARKPPTAQEDAFDQAMTDKGTRQEISDREQ